MVMMNGERVEYNSFRKLMNREKTGVKQGSAAGEENGVDVRWGKRANGTE